MDYRKGWFAVPFDIMSEPIFQGPNGYDMLRIWFYLESHAAFKDRSEKNVSGGKDINVKAGQAYISLRTAAKALNMPKSTLDDRLRAFEKAGFLDRFEKNPDSFPDRSGTLLTLIKSRNFEKAKKKSGQHFGHTDKSYTDKDTASPVVEADPVEKRDDPAANRADLRDTWAKWKEENETL